MLWIMLTSKASFGVRSEKKYLGNIQPTWISQIPGGLTLKRYVRRLLRSLGPFLQWLPFNMAEVFLKKFVDSETFSFW